MKKIFGVAVTTIVTAVVFICLPFDHLYAQSDYDVEKSKDTAHVPYTPPEEPEEQETETILIPTWPVKVPVHVPVEKKEKEEE